MTAEQQGRPYLDGNRLVGWQLPREQDVRRPLIADETRERSRNMSNGPDSWQETVVGKLASFYVRAAYARAAAPACDVLRTCSPNTTRTRCVTPSSTRGMTAGSTASPSNSACAIPRQR